MVQCSKMTRQRSPCNPLYKYSDHVQEQLCAVIPNQSKLQKGCEFVEMGCLSQSKTFGAKKYMAMPRMTLCNTRSHNLVDVDVDEHRALTAGTTIERPSIYTLTSRHQPNIPLLQFPTSRALMSHRPGSCLHK